ncbi:rab proteins geranylgeranyltransferase component A [Trichomonascus vanleenenianus]|uniref:GTPase-activating protein MRS6 n=1 Tax=Trichomonascus vanleenenianus TaxID=2268995 RepID=UPI003ECABB98
MSSYSATAATRRGSIVPPLSGVDSPAVSAVPEQCDVLICGTGLVESITAAALAWQGTSVIHVDKHPYYGDVSASLTVDQLKGWVDQVNQAREPGVFSKAMLYIPRPLSSRQYLIDLAPRLMFARSDLLDLLIKSRVSRYLEFKALGSFHTFENDSFEKVAGSKEEIFTDQSLTLLTKRSLMRFMKFTLEWESQPEVWQPYANEPIGRFLSEQFKLGDQQVAEIVLSIGLCKSLEVPTVKALRRIGRYLTSLDVYGSFPTLYSMYGSASEISQGFCRSAAVAGATYKLSSRLMSYSEEDKIALFEDGSRVRYSEKLIISPSNNPRLIDHSHVPRDKIPPQRQVTRMVAIVAKDCKEWFAENESAAVVIFPPGTLSTNNRFVVQAIIMGFGSGQCPEGQAVWYLSTLEDPNVARNVLEEALHKLETTILRESTEDFEVEGLNPADVSYRDGLPVVSSVKLGQSMQNFVPKEKLQFLLKLCYTQQISGVEQAFNSTAVIHTQRPNAEITYDGIVPAARSLYASVVGSDDDFFDVDFEDEEDEVPQAHHAAEDHPPDDGHHVGDIGDEMEL